MAYNPPAPLLASTVLTATGTGPAVAVDGYGGNANILVSVSSVAGISPSATFSLQWSHDGGTTWAGPDPADPFTALTANGAAVKRHTVKGPLVRLVWTISGTTPSFTTVATIHVTT